MRLPTWIIITALAALLAGCGVRGTLEPPPSAATPEGEPEVVAPEDDPDFILDGLLL
ncbi:MAG: hypothetical protein KI785_08245 [Devosiaceae bacterium]|nr:hypothetical protein [Devosiaceae bacterium MH13]